jgi:hypothetical protein
MTGAAAVPPVDAARAPAPDGVLVYVAGWNSTESFGVSLGWGLTREETGGSGLFFA